MRPCVLFPSLLLTRTSRKMNQWSNNHSHEPSKIACFGSVLTLHIRQAVGNNDLNCGVMNQPVTYALANTICASTCVACVWLVLTGSIVPHHDSLMAIYHCLERRCIRLSTSCVADYEEAIAAACIVKRKHKSPSGTPLLRLRLKVLPNLIIPSSVAMVLLTVHMRKVFLTTFKAVTLKAYSKVTGKY